MVERARRPRMGLAHSSPGALGVTARPNDVGPSGNGLVKRMNAGRKSCGIKGVRMGAPVRLQKAVPRSKENAAVERREVNALRHWACAARRLNVTRAFRCSAPLTFCEESSPPRGEGNARRSPRLARTEAAKLWLFECASSPGCLKCESGDAT